MLHRNSLAPLILAALLLVLFSRQTQAATADLEEDVFNVEALKAYDGAVIREIHIHGLKRTREQAVRWLLSQHEGDTFAAEKWVLGIHKLYDTTVLYNITTTMIPVAGADATTQAGAGAIDIDVQVVDRWTLLPFGIAQAGGGSNNIGVGLADVNFLGTFAQVAASYSVFNNVASYDFNLYQEFFRDTDYLWGLDISGVGSPVSLQANNGSSLGFYTWLRQQEQILIGHKFTSEWEAKIRLLVYFNYFRDHMVQNQQAPEVHVYNSAQYSVHPILILGRSELTNFLEQGQEITLAPTSANLFEGKKSYTQGVVSYKKVFLNQNTNYAFFFGAGAMTYAAIPYLFHLGGYDTVRGFSTNRAVGRYYAYDNLEYRPYLTRFGLPIPFFGRLIGDIVVQGALFTDSGVMWNSADLSETRRVNSKIGLVSAGGGIRLNFLRFAGAIVRIDVAKTIAPQEGWGGSLGVGQFF